MKFEVYRFCWGRISSCEEWEEKNMEKKKRGSNIILPLILRLLGRISTEEGKGTKILGKKIKISKKWGWGRISSCREHYNPLMLSIKNCM